MADIGSPAPISAAIAMQMAAQAGFSATTKVAGTPYTQRQVIVAIAIAESGLDAHAWNPKDPNGGSFGILQINGYWQHPQSGPAISRSNMLDPQSAFNYAYNVISQHGTVYTDWSTFTHGLYKQHIDTIGAATGSKAVQNAFQLPKNGWWSFQINGNFGHYPDTQGNYPKPDINMFGIPANFPIAAILPGTISGFSGDGSRSYGDVVTVKLDTPINAIATHYALLHLARLQPGIHIGQHVNPGDVLAYGGGNQSHGSAPAALGFALLPGDDYANGTWFNQYINTPSHVADQRLNPEPIVRAAQNGTLGITQFSNQVNVNFNTNQSGSQQFGQATNLSDYVNGVIQKSPLPTTPNPGVDAVLEAIDYALEIINPIPDASSVDQISFFGGTIPNPISWVSDFLYNVFVVDLSAIVVRGLIIALGAYICFKVINNFINFQAAAQGITNVAKTGAMIAAGA